MLPLVGLLCTFDSARAVLNIEITEGVEGALPVAIVPFAWVGAGAPPPEDVAAVISADLRRSGRFDPVPERDFLARPHEGTQVRFRDWRILGTESLVVGKVRASGGSYVVQFQLFDVFKGVQLAGYSVPSSAKDLRHTAHQLSDIIYETLTGEPGAFATRIAYVTEARDRFQNRSYSLKVADADGFNEVTAVRSIKPLMSPAWSADGSKLAYVSFENGRSEVYVQSLDPPERELLASYPGINGAPAWSPDGTKLALALSKDGNVEIYVRNLANKRLQRITQNFAIDTEPTWSPDGASIVFTSDRGGKPQLYRVSSRGGRVQRLTFEGDYNARASFSPDGRSLTMVHRSREHFQIGVMDLETGALRVLTDTRLDESPSFAPNGSMIIYATEVNNRGILAAVSIDGRVRQRLNLQDGNAREPAWGPYSSRR